MSKDLNFNLSPEAIKTSALQLVKAAQKYVIEIFAVFVLAVYGFMVFQINSYANIAPNEDKVLEEQQVIKRPQIDEDAVSKIEQLQSENIAVQALFKEARQNPFKP